MPTTELVTLYKAAELPTEAAKERARTWYRDGALDYDWWDAVYEDFGRICEILGVDLDTKGGTRKTPAVYFSGFWSQGDGACFEGSYSYRSGAWLEIVQYAPKDEELQRIALGLQRVQRRNFYRLTARCVQRGHYQHSGCMRVEVDGTDDVWVSACDTGEVVQLLRDLADWLYAQLEKEHDYLTSDEAVDEAMEANGYSFTEDGEFWG